MLEIKNITKFYGKVKALDDVSLYIPKGCCYGLVGPNGAGKTTLIKIITTIIQKYNGIIEQSDGIKTSYTKREWKYNMGYVPQDICLEERVTAYNNLLFFGRLYGLTGKQLKQRVNDVLKEIGLFERRKDKVATFSGGMKRRLNIGCALLHEPSVIIMDEPTVGIDPQSRRFIFNLIRKMKEDGCTIIYTSHYMEEIEQLCDYVAFIDNGKVIKSGKLNDLLNEYIIPTIFIQGEIDLKQYELGVIDIKKHKEGYLMMTEKPLKTLASLIKIYETEKLTLDRLELVHPRLEDVFFSLTGSELKDKKA